MIYYFKYYKHHLPGATTPYVLVGQAAESRGLGRGVALVH